MRRRSRFLGKRQFGREQAEFLCAFDRFGGALGDSLLERLVQVRELGDEIPDLILPPART